MNNKNKDRYSEGESEGEWDKVVITLVTISLSSIFFSFLILFITDNAQFVAKFKDTGTVGDTIGGLMNPFIALAGVLITFLAFYMQIKANRIQIKLFNKNQIEQNNLIKEQLFYRLVDNLNQRVLNFTFSENRTQNTFSTYNAIDQLVNYFIHSLDTNCFEFGKYIVCNTPELVEEEDYYSIMFPSGNNIDSQKVNEFKDIISSTETKDKNNELLKRLYTNGYSEKIDSGFKKIGIKYFYNVEYKHRKTIYNKVYNEVFNKYSSFLDGYTKNFSYVIEFIKRYDKDNFYKEYLINNLSSQELLIIFYYFTSDKATSSIKRIINELSIFNGLQQIKNKFFNNPSEEVISNEIKFMLDI